MTLKAKTIVGIARLAAMMPRMRRLTVMALNRTPRLRRRLKQAAARAIAMQHPAPQPGEPPEDAFLSPYGKRVMRDLRIERTRLESQGIAPETP